MTPLRTDNTQQEPTTADALLRHADVARALSLLGEGHSSMFMVKDREHRFVLVNQRFADMMGRSRDEIHGHDELELGIPEALLFGDPDSNLPGVRNRDEEAMKTGEQSRLVDGQVKLSDGQVDSALTVRTPVHDTRGEVIGLIIQVIDISDVRRLELEIESTTRAATNLDSKLSRLDQLLRELVSCHDHALLLQKITDTMVTQTMAEGAYLSMPTPSGDALELIAASCPDPEKFLGLKWRKDEGLVGKAWTAGETMYFPDANAGGATYAFEEHTQVCVLPVMDHGQIIAVMSVTLVGENAPSLNDDIPTLRRIMALGGVALSNSRLLATTGAALMQTRTLADVSQRLGIVDNPDTACQLVCDALTPAFAAASTMVAMFDNNDQLNIHGFSAGVDFGNANSHADEWPSARLEALTADVQKHLAQNPSYNGPIDIHGTADLADDGGGIETSSHALIFPIKKHNQYIGVLYVDRQKAGLDADNTALDVLTTVAGQLGSALERQELTQALHHQAYHDQLTGLPNRHQFEKELNLRLRSDSHGAVLFIDLDGFKEVNDTLGHAVGDELLKQVSERLTTCVGSVKFLARMGGDEFAVILSEQSGSADPTCVGQRIVDSLSLRFIVDTASISIGASVGLSLFPADGDCVDSLLSNADAAMYQAKQAGKGQVLSFDREITADIRRRTQVQNDLQNAIEQDELIVHYQPQVCCATGQVCSVEALVRWIHPERGMIPPGDFIPVAEASGLINELGNWVLNRAVQQIFEWQNTPLESLRVGVNIAANQFQHPGFTDFVIETLEKHSAPASQLELEVTESVVMNDVTEVAERLAEIRAAGIRIAVDDFGTGYSSLSYLQDLPLDVLKIDRAFVSRLQTENPDQSLANTISLLASGLGLETVAEGVETVEQYEAIKKIGCKFVQGYFHSRPVAAELLPDVISQIHADNDLQKAA